MSATQAELIAMYRAIALRGEQFRGLSVLSGAESIGEMVREHQAQTLLDFGSGAGDAYASPHLLHERWGVPAPTLYDPAFPGIDTPLASDFRVDGVICSDVLEHVPMAGCEDIIATLFEHANRFVWASVCTRAAKKSFANGMNMHVTVRPIEWWGRAFDRAAARTGIAYRLVETL